MRPGKLISLRSGRPVTAVVPVHLYGQMADMDAILSLADQYSLMVIEDACQAHGAEYFSKKHSRWMKAGSMGRAAAFSFYPGKNLGACGEGGAVTTNDPSDVAAVRMLRDHGQVKKYYHDLEGTTGGWMQFRREFFTPSCLTWRSGTASAASVPKEYHQLSRRDQRRADFLQSQVGREGSITYLQFAPRIARSL